MRTILIRPPFPYRDYSLARPAISVCSSRVSSRSLASIYSNARCSRIVNPERSESSSGKEPRIAYLFGAEAWLTEVFKRTWRRPEPFGRDACNRAFSATILIKTAPFGREAREQVLKDPRNWGCTSYAKRVRMSIAMVQDGVRPGKPLHAFMEIVHTELTGNTEKR